MYETEAIVDTGAVRSVLPRHVCDELGVAVVAERVATYAGGRKDGVGLTGPIRFESFTATRLTTRWSWATSC